MNLYTDVKILGESLHALTIPRNTSSTFFFTNYAKSKESEKDKEREKDNDAGNRQRSVKMGL